MSKIVAKGNRVVFAPDRSYIENVSSGRKIDMQLTNGTYAIDVEWQRALLSGRSSPDIFSSW